MPSRSDFFESLFDREKMRKRYPHYDTSLSAYLRDLGPLPLLTAEQETELLTRAVNGDINAQEQLVKANVRLIVTIAVHYQGQGLPILDLIQEGNVGLLKAIKRFDFEKTQRLSTYAKHWIRSEIQRAVAEHGTLIHASFRTGEYLQIMREAITMFEDQGIEPTPTTIATHLKWPMSKVIELLDLMQQPLDLYQRDPEHGGLAERLVAPPVFLSNDIVLPTQLFDVREVIRQVLTHRQRLVIENRFGLNEEGVIYNYREIAAKFFDRTGPRADVSIREIEKNALARLRTAFDGKEA